LLRYALLLYVPLCCAAVFYGELHCAMLYCAELWRTVLCYTVL